MDNFMKEVKAAVSGILFKSPSRKQKKKKTAEEICLEELNKK